MSRKRYRKPFWRRKTPVAKHDIAILRSPRLGKGSRFETGRDVQIESERSELLLKQASGGAGRRLAETLQTCRENHQRCDQTYCPQCARVFRRWFIGELLRFSDSAKPVTILTVLLKKAPKGGIDALDPRPFRGILRRRLIRAGLGDAVVIGAFENVYRAQDKDWMLHINLMIIGGQSSAIGAFKTSFEQSDIERPAMKAPLKEPAKQLSYLPKFTTYHRPYEQLGAGKGPATPLNPQEHLALVEWMAKRSFKDLVFLFNARQGVDSIVPSKKLALNA
jgi:hypothetical protein